MDLKELIREAKAQFPIMKVADLLGLQLKYERTPSGEFYRGDCPLCHKARTFRIEPAKERYGCFDCAKNETPGCRGDGLQLIQSVKGLKNVKAACEFLMGSVGGTERRTVKRAVPPTTAPTTELQPDHPDVEALGFDPEDAKRIGIGWSDREGAVLIPVRLEDGTLVGYVAAQEVIPLDFHFPDPTPQPQSETNIVRLRPKKTG